MGKVYVFAAVMIIIASVAVFGLFYAKIAQKMFSSRKNKEINK